MWGFALFYWVLRLINHMILNDKKGIMAGVPFAGFVAYVITSPDISRQTAPQYLNLMQYAAVWARGLGVDVNLPMDLVCDGRVSRRPAFACSLPRHPSCAGQDRHLWYQSPVSGYREAR